VSDAETPEQTIRSSPPLAQDVLEYEQTARKAASSGQLLTAIEVTRDGLERFGPTPVLQQQLALALAQTGALDGAREVLADLLKHSKNDEETLSLLGRVYKELWRRANDPAAAANAIQQACKFYGDAFALNEAYYPGINLAFTFAAAGELKQAEAIARKVEKICREKIKKADGSPDGWVLATLAEALTHQGATVAAGDFYRQAAAAFEGRWRDLASMRKQAREILGFAAKAPADTRSSWYDLASIQRRAREFFGRTEKGHEWLDRCFTFPSVVVFSGHMIDQPGRTPPRFPLEREPEVRGQIRAYLEKVKPGFGYSSAACGADIIFCECLLELGAKIHLVLPCPVDAFKRQSVSFAGPAWEKRFHHVLAMAETLLIANTSDYAAAENDPASSMGLVYANRIITGLAVLQAQALDFELRTLAVWDGRKGAKNGGTGSVVADWRDRQLEPHIISLGSADGASEPAISAAAETPPPAVRHEIKAMVFAEVLNYQKIRERQVPAFVTAFQAAIANLLVAMPSRPAVAESWGRSQYFVYDSLQHAALFALELRDLIVHTPWAERGLPADLGIRIVLHAGPVFSFTDPVLQRPLCAGAHVMRPARIEPITPPGQVYASQEFAALCSAEDLSAVSFEFLGRRRTTVLFEDAPLYRLDRRRRGS